MTSRRDFLKTSAAATAALTCGALSAGGCASIPSGPFVAGPLTDYPEDERTKAKATNVFIIRSDAGVAAISGKCTHLGCGLSIADPDEDEGDGYICGCHGSRFDQTGAVTEGPADEPLAWFHVSINGGQVTVDPSKPVPPKTFTRA